MRYALFLAFFIVLCSTLAKADAPVPTLAGEAWTVSHSPDLGAYTSEKQEPVDFACWQAADGTWQIWSCIRATKCGGHTRLLYRWEGKNLTDKDWTPKGIAMEADESLDESKGGLQAPHVIKHDGKYWMFYGDWKHICLATSTDGKTFTRHKNKDGKPQLFIDAEDFINCRDAMVINIGGLWHCYYCVTHPEHKGKIYYRTSRDLINWDAPQKVSAGSECPFVVEHTPDNFYLFRCHSYGEKGFSRVIHSTDPHELGLEREAKVIGRLPCAAAEIVQDKGGYYIAYLRPDLKGIMISKLEWK